jgi:membrane protease YdiL (CAAX protease family)
MDTNPPAAIPGPSVRQLAAFWALGVGGCDLLAWAGLNIFQRHGHVFLTLALLCMLAAGIFVWRRWYREMEVFSRSGWLIGAVIAFAVLLNPLVGGFAALHFGPWRKLLATLFWCALVGFSEELWWRGIWFEMFADRPRLCILGGSLAFAAYHFPFHGFALMIKSGFVFSVFSVGLLFCAARRRGASVGVLAAAHALVDWPQYADIITWRHDGGPAWSVAVCTALSVLLLMLPLPAGDAE